MTKQVQTMGVMMLQEAGTGSWRWRIRRHPI